MLCLATRYLIERHSVVLQMFQFLRLPFNFLYKHFLNLMCLFHTTSGLLLPYTGFPHIQPVSSIPINLSHTTWPCFNTEVTLALIYYYFHSISPLDRFQELSLYLISKTLNHLRKTFVQRKSRTFQKKKNFFKCDSLKTEFLNKWPNTNYNSYSTPLLLTTASISEIFDGA